jgi:hypothetical protein
MSDELEMARHFYGFGRWDAPYWFIGPEQGKGPGESVDNSPRVNAWLKLQKPELCDCRAFHELIGEQNWHRDSRGEPRLQRTWRPLMLLLKSFLNHPASPDDLRNYQRDFWGRGETGETCVIELSAVAAKALRTEIDRMRFREERVGWIREQIGTHKPRLMVMYGKSEKRYWQDIAEAQLEFERPYMAAGTIFVMTPHPNTRGRTDSDWVSLGARLRELENSLPESTSSIARASESI